MCGAIAIRGSDTNVAATASTLLLRRPVLARVMQPLR
jgi:hypothetical protein